MTVQASDASFGGATRYVLDEELAQIVNISMALEMPLLLKGEPGTGKTMLASRLPGILPPLSETEALDAAAIASISQRGLDLARWLVAADNPLTARVAVNRFWQQYFGTGIVKTSEDFGAQGEWPSHPELLDFLAKELVASGYNLKHLYRLILNSRTYQLSCKTNDFNAKDVAHFSHYQVKRLGAETLLDAIGQVTEELMDVASQELRAQLAHDPVLEVGTGVGDGELLPVAISSKCRRRALLGVDPGRSTSRWSSSPS